jgi:hypothetical protein
MIQVDQPFIPPWAEGVLTKPRPIDAEELKLLREFYSAWIGYHTIPHDRERKDKQRIAGAHLIVLHEALKKRLEDANAR